MCKSTGRAPCRGRPSARSAPRPGRRLQGRRTHRRQATQDGMSSGLLLYQIISRHRVFILLDEVFILMSGFSGIWKKYTKLKPKDAPRQHNDLPGRLRMADLLEHALVPHHWPGEAMNVLGLLKVDFRHLCRWGFRDVRIGRCLRHFKLVLLAFFHVVTVDLARRVDIFVFQIGSLQGTDA